MDPRSFLEAPGVIVDVRAPSEFSHAHIPASHSLPLFSDEERSQVGTVYKQVGKECAFDLGLSLASPKFSAFIKEARECAALHGQLKVTCARGGMRSESMAWLFSMAGLRVVRLKGGYKAYRQFVLSVLEKSYPFVVLGGLTGSGKSEILQALKKKGAAVLDLEALANHRGSSFGHLGEQPSNEQFENNIAEVLFRASQAPLFVEDESRLVGRAKIFDALFAKMREAPLIEIQVSQEERVARILRDYGALERKELLAAFQRIEKRLGSVSTKRAMDAVMAGDLACAITIALDYYDKAYKKMLETRAKPLFSLRAENLSAEEWAERILSYGISSF